MTSLGLRFWERTLYTVEFRVAFSNPKPVVAFPCGSRSMRRTLLPSSATAAATLTEVVVLPVPPLLFRILTIKGKAQIHTR